MSLFFFIWYFLVNTFSPSQSYNAAPFWATPHPVWTTPPPTDLRRTLLSYAAPAQIKMH